MAKTEGKLAFLCFRVVGSYGRPKSGITGSETGHFLRDFIVSGFRVLFVEV